MILIIVVLQIVYLLLKSDVFGHFQTSLSFDAETQAQIDRLKKEQADMASSKTYLFNPNFISDYKGYTLGMSPEEIDRLHAFRATDKYLNSAEHFQEITLISDSLFDAISPNFKFPDWTQKDNQQTLSTRISLFSKNKPESAPNSKEVNDLNLATAEDLKAIRGVGNILSARIIKFRNRLGGFVINEQLYDVYGLDPEVVKLVLKKYSVFSKPDIKTININSSSAGEISSLVYIKYSLATEIVSYRDKNGAFTSLDELHKIEGFPSEKINRIALYLSL